jgi:hypothetical protein
VCRNPAFCALSFFAVCFLLAVPMAYGDGHKTFRPRIGQTYEEFWQDNLSELFEEKLFPLKYEISFVNERLKLLRDEVWKRFGKTLNVSLVTVYNPSSRLILFGASSKKGLPNIDIVIPVVIDVYLMHRKGDMSDWRKIFEVDMIISLFHELEHLAYGDLGLKVKLVELARSEADIWAMTCEDTVGPLVDRYRVVLSKTIQFMCTNWLQSGRDKDSFRWQSFITRIYSVTRPGTP